MYRARINVSYIGKYIFLFILLLPFIGISNFQYISQLDRLTFFSNFINKLWYINAIIISICIIYYFFYTKRFISIPCFLCVCLFSYVLIRTFVGGDVSKNVITFILMGLFGEVYILKKKEIFLVFIDVLNTFIFFNLLFIIKYMSQGGLVYWSVREQRVWKGYYLLGYDNGFIIVILPLICYTLIMYREGRNKKYLLMLIMQVLSVILIKSVASFIALGCFGIFTLFQSNKIFKKVFYNPLNIIFVHFTCFYGFVVLKVQYIISDVIYYLFHKGLDTTRWRLWNEGLEKAGKSLLWGYGYGIEVFGNNYLSPHNLVLEWITQGGIIELLGYFVLIYIALKQLNKNIEYPPAKILYNGIIAFMFGYMAEGYSTYRSYWMFLLLLLISARLEYLNHLFTLENINYQK